MTTKTIWDLYHRDIKSFIFSKIKNEEITNDLVQETFIKIHTKLYTLKNVEKVKSWSFSIANFTVLDFFRENKLKIDFNENSPLEFDENSKVHSEIDCLFGILKTLPKKYRDPLFLSDIKGMKQKEIAAILKLELPTTKSRIQRARKLIKQGYVKCCDYKIDQKGYLVGEIKSKEDCKICNN